MDWVITRKLDGTDIKIEDLPAEKVIATVSSYKDAKLMVVAPLLLKACELFLAGRIVEGAIAARNAIGDIKGDLK